MSAKNICVVLFAITTVATPSVSNAASVDHFFSSGAYGSASGSTSDSCTSTSFYVSGSESTFKGGGAGPAIPTPSGYIDVYLYNRCTQRASYLWGSSDTITFSHTPATHGSFPDSVTMSADFTVRDNAGTNKSVHVELRLVSSGGQYEYVYSRHYEYPSGDQTVKVDDDSKGHEAAATGSLDISGDFQFTNPSVNGYVGVSTTRSHTVVHQ